MRKGLISWLVTAATVFMFATVIQAGTFTSEFDRYLADNQFKDEISAIITMSDRVDLEVLKSELSARKADRQQWHETVVKALQDKATESQADILAKLDSMVKQGEVSSYENFWLGNLIVVTAKADAFNELVLRSDVDQIAPNYKVESIKDFESTNVPATTSGIEDGISAIHADEVWAMGYTGEGRLVSHLDTGVDGSHEALDDNWRGNDSRYADNPGWAWFDPFTDTEFPFDDGSHGTHTMGTICGLGETNGDTIGVAFDAEWISAGVIDRLSGDQEIAGMIAALEWIADPDGDPSTVWDVPDVCSNSWGVYTGDGSDYAPCDETFWEVIDCAEAAGVVVIFAAGNEGQEGEETMRAPADRALTGLNCFAVGAVNGGDNSFPLAYFSSLGPTHCTPDGSADIKPEVVAPGMDVRSAYAGTDNSYTYMSGTSMACPHVSGVVALMRQANPNLTVDQVKQILLDTAVDLGDGGEDNEYGMGIIDAYEAVQVALSYRDDFGVLTGTVTDLVTGDPIEGATVSTIDGSWSVTSNAAGVYSLVLPSDTDFDMVVDYSPTHLPVYDTQSVSGGDTTFANYTLESKVSVTFTVSFGNGSDISYRDFYIKGSWDDIGRYDASWSGDFIAVSDDGESPDETAGDGIFTAEVLLARDLENSYSWNVYTENYSANSDEDALLASGEDFDITGYDAITVPTLSPNPSGSDNDFVFSVEGDNGLSFDLEPEYNDEAGEWGLSTSLTTGVTYNFKFHVMHSDQVTYGVSGVGGEELSYTPVIDGDYEIIFNDNDDTHLVLPADSDGPPQYLYATGGSDGHIPVAWLDPGDISSAELSYDDGVINNAYYFNSYTSLAAVMFLAESYPVVIDSVSAHIITEGDDYWPWPDDTHDPLGLYIFSLSTEGGWLHPADEPIYYEEVTAELGVGLRVDIPDIVMSGPFFVAIQNLSTGGFDALALDAVTHYPPCQWYYLDGEWGSGGYLAGDQMIRAKVISNDVSTWLAYDDGIPAGQYKIPVTRNIEWDETVATSKHGGYNTGSGQLETSIMPLYYPRITSVKSLITETETVLGYNLYRGTSTGPYNQGLKINDALLTGNTYGDWGNDSYGPIDNGTTYYYQTTVVYDIDGTNVEVGPSNQSIATPQNQPPDTPENLSGEVDDFTINLSWDTNTDYDIASYNIYRCDYLEYSYSLVGNVVVPGVTYTEELTESGFYRYKLKAVDVEGMESDSYSDYIELEVGAPSPSRLTASEEYEFKIKLEWSAPGVLTSTTDTEDSDGESDTSEDIITDVTRYRVYRSDSEDGTYELLTSVSRYSISYYDQTVDNGVPYYYRVTALYGTQESGPTNTAEGWAVNYVPEAPTDLTNEVTDYTVSLAWEFTNDMEDLDHYNIYRKSQSDDEWALVGTSTTESYTEEVTDGSGTYHYCVSAVDNGSPQLESEYSDFNYVYIGNLPPRLLTATSSQDGVVPLRWLTPEVQPCTTFIYDTGDPYLATYSHSNPYILAKRFNAEAPVEVCSAFVHVATAGDGFDIEAYPDGVHDPVIISVFQDNGSGRPGEVLAETTVTCEMGEWIAVGFPMPIICNTNNFWIGWNNIPSGGYDAICADVYSNDSRDWLGVYGEGELAWSIYESTYSSDLMIRASISLNSTVELLTEDNPVSGMLSQNTLTGEIPVINSTEEMLGYYIYRSTSPDVPINDDYRITSDYLTSTLYEDGDVTNGTTYYYVCAAAYDNDGTTELVVSDEVSAMPIVAGQLEADVSSISETSELGGDPVTVPITLTNVGGLPVTMNTSVGNVSLTATSGSDTTYTTTIDLPADSVIMVCSDISNDDEFPVTTSTGGPDDYGYYWIDSDDEYGPEYNWIDITGIGESLELADNWMVVSLSLGFGFTFYGNTFYTLNACSDGFISFDCTSSKTTHREFPSYSVPYNTIAPLWYGYDYADFSQSSFYYYTNYVDTVVVSWYDVEVRSSDTETYTFQIILTHDNVITMQYQNTNESSGSNHSCVGIQNGDASVGMTISYNDSYLHDGLAIRICPPWLSTDPTTTTIEAGESITLNAILDPITLTRQDTYTNTLNINGYDENHDCDPISIPVTFAVDDTVSVDDDITSMLPDKFSLEQNYPNPFNANTEIKYALPVDSRVKLEVYNVLGQKVTTLVDEKQEAGYHSLIWNGTNESGKVVSSGLYLYKLVTDEDSFLKKMIMLK